MIARTALISFLLLCYLAIGQEVSLPADLRQHTLTQYNASLFNPTFTLDRNNPQSISFWTRWQWQQIDTDPTTLFLNYSRSINEKSGFGAGFFQHNTGIYFNTGGVVNYAYELKLNPIIKLSVGANLFGFQQQLADTRFLPNPNDAVIPVDVSDDFILQLAPGFNLSVENFSLSMASENLFDYNVTDKGANTETSDKIFMGMASYDFPIMTSDSTAFLRPSIYLRTIPEQQNQIGLNTLFSAQKYWAQAGYNNFYGISVGAGGTVFNRVSVGALVEFGTSASLNSKDASFEIIASYFLGNPSNRRKPIVNVFDALENDVVLLDEEAKAAIMREELENAQKVATEQNTAEKETIEETPLEKEEESIEETPIVKEEESAFKEVPTIDKKEARKLAAQEKALAKERRRDSLDRLKKEKETLVLKEKEEKENVKLAEEEARIVEKALKKKKEEEALAAVEEAKRIAALNEEEKAKEAGEELKKAQALAEEEREKLERRKDSLTQAKKMEETVLMNKKEEQRLADFIKETNAAKVRAQAEQLEIQKQQDSIRNDQEELVAKNPIEETETVEEVKITVTSNKVTEVEEVKEEPGKKDEQVKEVVTPKAGEKYEEVVTEDGLEPGYYLIANVFGTKRYFDAFMIDLKKKGISPGSFVRSRNNYNYVYLKRYNTISQARSARDTRFGGKYQAKTWIFRVVGE